jgi:hypothetical protein
MLRLKPENRTKQAEPTTKVGRAYQQQKKS